MMQHHTLTATEAKAYTLDQLKAIGRFNLRHLAGEIGALDDETVKTAFLSMSNDDMALHVHMWLNPPATPFGTALRNARHKANISKVDLGGICGVTGMSVFWWEEGTNVPVLENYNKLLDVFPELRDVPSPGPKDIETPSGRFPFAATYKPPVQPTLNFSDDEEPQPTTPSDVPPSAEQPMQQPNKIAAILAWTKASTSLKLSKQQAVALSELMRAGVQLNYDIEAITQVLEQWPTQE